MCVAWIEVAYAEDDAEGAGTGAYTGIEGAVREEVEGTDRTEAGLLSVRVRPDGGSAGSVLDRARVGSLG